jgi:hypothetical protein
VAVAESILLLYQLVDSSEYLWIWGSHRGSNPCSAVISQHLSSLVRP